AHDAQIPRVNVAQRTWKCGPLSQDRPYGPQLAVPDPELRSPGGARLRVLDHRGPAFRPRRCRESEFADLRDDGHRLPRPARAEQHPRPPPRSEEHTSELQSLTN